MRHLFSILILASVAFCGEAFSQDCKAKPLVKQNMKRLEPYKYDAYAIKEITYGPRPKKETINFEVFSEEEYKLVFCQTKLPSEVEITIYGLVKGKKNILYFDESGRKSQQTFNFGPTKSGTYYIEYTIPPQTAPNQKGCFVVLIGLKD